MLVSHPWRARDPQPAQTSVAVRLILTRGRAVGETGEFVTTKSGGQMRGRGSSRGGWCSAPATGEDLRLADGVKHGRAAHGRRSRLYAVFGLRVQPRGECEPRRTSAAMPPPTRAGFSTVNDSDQTLPLVSYTTRRICASVSKELASTLPLNRPRGLGRGSTRTTDR
jgi:hypothetical protein